MVHHPTVIAAHGEGEHWSFAGDAEVRSKFWGRSIELTPVGLIRLKFDDGDEYTWAKVSAPSFITPSALCTAPVTCILVAAQQKKSGSPQSSSTDPVAHLRKLCCPNACCHTPISALVLLVYVCSPLGQAV